MAQNQELHDFPFKEGYEKYLELVEIAFFIHQILGYGLSNKIYKKAFEIELDSRGIEYIKEKRYTVDINGMVLDNEFYSDFVIDERIIVEILSVPFHLTDNDLSLFRQLVVAKPKIFLIINFHNELIQFKKIELI